MNIPVTISTPESVQAAELPALYQNAQIALAQCSDIDECQKWGDKAKALASYAKQAQDQTLHSYAKRIQARAIRRAGELLKQIEPAQGSHWESKRDGAVPSISRSQAADDAGMSERQRKTALRVASVPEDEFNAAVDSDEPPTVTKLAEQGRQRVNQPPRREFNAATDSLGALERFVQQTQKFDPLTVANGLMSSEISHAKQLVAKADSWLDRFIVTLENRNDD